MPPLGANRCQPGRSCWRLRKFPPSSQHPTCHPLPPATPVLDITSILCSSWILHTLFARNPLGTDSIGCKSFPTWLILLALREISRCISAPHLPPFATSNPSTGYNIHNMFFMDSAYSVCQKSLGN